LTDPNFTPELRKARLERARLMLEGRWDEYYAQTAPDQWLSILDSIARQKKHPRARKAA